ncbi:hypothetical protein QQS21_003550 [Conoideocrella luteorostrata]|uniref:N-acetyltransferase domain-containing protein n=1 Tax=Conoideocrella luteorostrata TaxID=1105319 RepID=A0AAJ0FVG8_9HYPO|nr:hypothetical protein QQS21_003550 [Conoideocrella luteorostrata]
MESRPASDLSVAELADLFNKSFEDYMGAPAGINFTAESLSDFISLSYISIPHSHVFYMSERPSEPIGSAFIGIRPDKPTEVRLVSMGIFKASRGKGAGSKVLQLILEAERARGTQTVGLECIQQNAAGVRMYTAAGFSIVRELLGWERDAPREGEFAANPGLRPCSIGEVDVLVKTHGAADLPWQAWAFDTSTVKNRAFRLGDAYCVVSDPDDKESDMIKLVSFIVDPQSRKKGEADRLITAMLGEFPAKKWLVRPIFPKEYGESFAGRFGFVEMSLTQYQMEFKIV